MKTAGLERGCCLLLLDGVRLSPWADFHSPWSPSFLGPHVSFQPQIPSGQRECVPSGDVSSGGGTRAGTRSKEAKSRSPPPAPALPGPSRPHPGPGGAEWVGMAQNKKLIKSVSHLHPKIKERRKTSSDNSHAASGPGGPPSGNGWGGARVSGDMCRRPGPGPHPSSPVRRPQYPCN